MIITVNVLVVSNRYETCGVALCAYVILAVCLWTVCGHECGVRVCCIVWSVKFNIGDFNMLYNF